MATTLVYDNTDDSAAESHLTGGSPTLPIVIPQISDAADIVVAFESMWRGDPGVSAVGLGGYISNINSRLKNVESATQPSTSTQAVSVTMTPQADKFLLKNPSDATSKARFSIPNTASTTYVYTLPSPFTGSSDTIATLTSTQTFTNKTLTSPAINDPVVVGGTINNATVGATTPAAGRFTTVNKVTVTEPATAATLTLANNSSLITAGAFSVTLTATAPTSITLPTSGTLATTSNKLSAFASTTSTELAGVISDETGSAGGGVLVFSNSPSLTAPSLGAATATSINKVAITAPATSATLTIANAKTLTVNNTLTFSGTDSSSVAFGAGGTVLYAGGVAAATDITGTLPINRGGTGIATAPGNLQILQGNGTSYALTSTPTFTSLTLDDLAGGGDLLIKGDLTVQGNYEILGTTVYGAADIFTGAVTANGATTLDSYAVATYHGAEYVVTVKNTTSRSTYKLLVASFADGGANNGASIVVYGEVAAGTSIPTVTFDASQTDTTTTVTINTSSTCSVRFFRITTKETVI